MSHEPHMRSARLAESTRHDLLDRLDRHASGAHALRHDRANNRNDQRWTYRQNDIEVTVEHPAGGVSRLLLFDQRIDPHQFVRVAGGMRNSLPEV